MTFYVIFWLHYIIIHATMILHRAKEGTVNEVASRIKTNSLAIGVALILVAALLTVATLHAAWNWPAASPTYDLHRNINLGVQIGCQALFALLFVHLALTFFRISSQETPFFRKLPRRIKIAAVLLLAAAQVPRWIGYAVLSIATGRPTGVLFDEFGILALALALILFCLGQIFEYGYLLQDENYEII